MVLVDCQGTFTASSIDKNNYSFTFQITVLVEPQSVYQLLQVPAHLITPLPITMQFKWNLSVSHLLCTQTELTANSQSSKLLRFYN